MKRLPFTIIALAAASQLSAFAQTASYLQKPLSLVTDRDGYLYVADESLGKVQVFSPDGTKQKEINTNPYGANAAFRALAVDDAKNVYLINSWGQNYKFGLNDAGQYVLFDRILDRKDDPANPRSMALDGAGNIFIASKGKILKRSSNSRTVTVELDKLDGLEAIAVTHEGVIYFTMAGSTKKVCKATRHGTTYKIDPLVTHGLQNPTSIALDDAGNLYVADEGTGSINKYNPNGKLLHVADVGDPKAVAVHGSNVYFIKGTQVFACNPSSVSVPTAGENYCLRKPLTNQSDFSSVTVDQGNTIYVTDREGVYKCDPGFNDLVKVQTFWGNLAGLALDHNGNIYFSNYVGDILLARKPEDKKPNHVHHLEVGLEGPVGLVVGSHCNLAVAESKKGVIRLLFTFGGSGPNIAEGVNEPWAVAMNADNDVFFSTKDGIVWRVNYDAFNAKYMTKSPFLTGLSGKRVGLAFDRSNNLLVSDSGTATIKKYDLDGTLLSDVAKGLSFQSIAVDGDGEVYGIATSPNHDLCKIGRMQVLIN